MNISQRLRTCAKHTGLDAVIELLQEAADEIDALQARAQVQGEAFGYIHHFAAHDERGVLIDTTWEADGCADPLPHPTFPSRWKWTHCTPFYTTPQPAQATQAEVTDEQILEIAEPFGEFQFGDAQGHKRIDFARALLSLRPEPTMLTGCKCRWYGDTQVQWCELHLAHKDAIHEWAERAKEAEKQLALRPERQRQSAKRTPREIARSLKESGMACNCDLDRWEPEKATGHSHVCRIHKAAMSAHHGITAQAKKETP